MCAKSQLSIDVGQTYSNSGDIETSYTKQGWVYKTDTFTPPPSYVIYSISHQQTGDLGSNHYEVIPESNMANYATTGKIAQAYDSLITQLNTEIAEVSEISGKKGEERLQILLEKRQNIQYEKDLLLSKYLTSPLYTLVKFDLSANAT